MQLDLGWLFAIVVILLVIWKEGNRILQPVIAPLLELAGRAIRGVAGNLPALPAATAPAESNHEVTALESETEHSYHVTKPTCSELEIAWIAYELGKESTPSAVAKTLPKYSPRQYEIYAGKVAEVEALLAEKQAIELERSSKKATKPTPNSNTIATLQQNAG
jgi:hypothetical protein